MSEISIFKERILEYLDYKGVSKYEFYAETGVSNSVLSKKGGLSEDNALKFLSYYTDVNPTWFFTGNGEMLLRNVAAAKEPELIERGKKKSLPLIPINAMAGFANSPATVFDVDCEHYVVPIFKDADFLIPVRGNSMQPRYNSGDIVACKKLANARDMFFQWGKVYVLDTEQGAMLKRIQPGKDDEHILVVSDNPDPYKPFDLHLSQINAIAIVTGVIRLV